MPSRSLLAVFIVLLAAARAVADTVHLKGGRKMDAPDAVETPEGDILFKVGAGSITVKRDQIDWLEPADRNAAVEEFLKRRKPGTLDALCNAARFAALRRMTGEATSAWRAALEKDAACREAHEGLGHRLHEGKWLTEEEFQVATGHVLRDGKWIRKADSEKLDQGWEYVDGKLLAPDDAKRAKGLVLHEGKWIPKKELDELEAKKAAAEKEERDAEAKRHNPKDDEALLARVGSGWRLRVGKRYRLATNVDATPDEFDKKLVDMMDAFWPYYCETFNVRPVQKTLHNIIVYRTQEEFDAAPGTMKGAYGNYNHGDELHPAILWYMEKLRGSSFTSRHECGHQFVAHYVRGDGEAWFGEGIATIFECVGDVPFQDHLYRWEVVRKGVVEPGGFRLTDLVTGKQNDRSSIYCLGAAVHLFFLEGKDRAYRAAYQEFLKRGNTKSPEALAKVSGKTIDEVQAEFEAWVKDLDGKRKIFPPKK